MLNIFDEYRMFVINFQLFSERAPNILIKWCEKIVWIMKKKTSTKMAVVEKQYTQWHISNGH